MPTSIRLLRSPIAWMITIMMIFSIRSTQAESPSNPTPPSAPTQTGSAPLTPSPTVLTQKKAIQDVKNELTQHLTPYEISLLNRVEQAERESRKNSWLEPKNLIGLGGWTLGLAGWIFTVVGLLIQRNWARDDERDRLKREDEAKEAEGSSNDKARLYEALRWFEGNTQKRNIGLAIIEAYMAPGKANIVNREELRLVWQHVLLGQILHLLGDRAENSLLERQNLVRALKLLKDFGRLLEPTIVQKVTAALEFKSQNANVGLAHWPPQYFRNWQEVFATQKPGITDAEIETILARLGSTSINLA